MLKHLFWFSERANRAEFVFWGVIFYTLTILFPFLQRSFAIDVTNLPASSVLLFALLHILVSLVCCVAGWLFFTLQVRRFHDLGLSGWWLILFNMIIFILTFLCLFGIIPQSFFYLVCILGLGLLLVLILKPGKETATRHGSYDKPFYPAFMNRPSVFWALVACFLLLTVCSQVYNLSYSKKSQQLFRQQVEAIQQGLLNQQQTTDFKE